MYSKYDREKKLLMIGFEAERLNQLISILMTYINEEGMLKTEATDILAFIETARLAIALEL